MKRVFICSRYSADTPEDKIRNEFLTRMFCAFAIKRGCAPFAPHLLYPAILDDSNKKQREQGINCGLAFLDVCDELWYDPNSKISEGMKAEIAYAKEKGITIKEFSYD